MTWNAYYGDDDDLGARFEADQLQAELERQGYRRDRLRKLYTAGSYRCPPAPVSSAHWDDDAWIDYIDANGEWTA